MQKMIKRESLEKVLRNDIKSSPEMETPDITPLLEQLEDDIDDLEEVLEPLLNQTLSAATQKLPLMDKAKLHVLITYTIESLLFSYLRLHGVKAKEHPVFKELTRVKQYFEKIKALETEPEKPNLTLNKEAAARFIKHGLAGNNKIDLERAEREAKEKAMAQLRASLLGRKKEAVPQKRTAEDENTPNRDVDMKDENETKRIKATEPPTVAEPKKTAETPKAAEDTQAPKATENVVPQSASKASKEEPASKPASEADDAKKKMRREKRRRQKQSRQKRKAEQAKGNAAANG